ncbi:hypothetical protein ACFVHQ_21660 [Actinomycetes bacterium NPDC127524]
MPTSLDVKVVGDYLKTERAVLFLEEYEKIHERYGYNAWICGRITMEEHFTFGHQLDLKEDNISMISRTDYIANKYAENCCLSSRSFWEIRMDRNSIAPRMRIGRMII